MSLPSVSIIIPVYNREETIARAVQSAFAQKFVDVEVIVVDDGSSDGTLAKLHTLKEEFGSRLEIISQGNAGASSARNRGLKAATAEYVQFLDSDDSLHDLKVSKQADELASNPMAAVALCYGWLQTPHGDEVIGQNLGAEPRPYLEAMCGRSVHVVQTSSPLWRRSFLSAGPNWAVELSLGDDLEFHTRRLAEVSQIVFVDQPLFTVHAHDGDRLSDFSTNSQRLGSLIATRELMYEALQKRNAWSASCEVEMVDALRAYYPVFLNQGTSGQLDMFERVATRILRSNWKTPKLRALSLTRSMIGRKGAALLSKAVLAALESMKRIKSIKGVRLRRKLEDALAEMHPTHRANERRALTRLDECARQKQSALFVEMNLFHSECIPGYIAILQSAGFVCTVLHRDHLDVEDAFARFSESDRPSFVPMSLRGIRRFLNSERLSAFDFKLFGSTIIAEKNTRFETVWEFLGWPPGEHNGFYAIEHSAMSRVQTSQHATSIERTFALREMAVSGETIPMLSPVEFGETSCPSFTEPVVFVVVGRFDPSVRNADALYSAVRGLADHAGPPFEVHLIGGTKQTEVPDDIRRFFRVLGRLSFDEMYKALEKSHFLLPLLDSRIPSHYRYLTKNTTGSRQLSLGFSKPMVMDSVFAEAYNFDASTSIIHAPGDLFSGMDQARRLGPLEFDRQKSGLLEMKRDLLARSMDNFVHALSKIARPK